MPELSRFFGIVIRMFHDDHGPAHFHASYGGDEALFDVEALAIIAGSLPPRAAGLVVEWAALHQAELRDAWRRAEALEPLPKIAPLT